MTEITTGLNWLFWLTGAAVWLALGGTFLLMLYGEWSYRRAANRFRRNYMSAEDYALLQEARAQRAARSATPPDQATTNP